VFISGSPGLTNPSLEATVWQTRCPKTHENHSSLLAAASLLLASCKRSVENSALASQTNRINVFLVESNAYSPDDGDPDPDSHQVTWIFRNKKNQALTNKIRSNQVVEWHFRSPFFLYIDESKSHVTNWDTCTDAASNSLHWITNAPANGLACPFNQTNHRALCATNIGDWVVSIVFPTNAAPYKTNIYYRLVTGDCPQTTLQADPHVLIAPYDYYMVEAILVWDDPNSPEPRAAPSQ
jgi:hypothetical protein